MTRDELIGVLRSLDVRGDPEMAHVEADEALLLFINDPEITEAFDAIDKWYA